MWLLPLAFAATNPVQLTVDSDGRVVHGLRGVRDEAPLVPDLSAKSAQALAQDVDELEQRREQLLSELAQLGAVALVEQTPVEAATAASKDDQSAAQPEKEAAGDESEDEKKASPEQIAATRREGRVYAVVAAFAALAVIVFELLHLQWSDVDWSKKVPLLDDESGEAHALEELNLEGCKSLASPYFFAPGKQKPMAIIAILLTVRVGMLAVSYISNELGGKYWDAIQNRDWPMFITALSAFCAILVIEIFAAAYVNYLASMLIIDWRQYLTRFFQKLWFQGQAFYKLQLRGEQVDDCHGLDNPDQRIEGDVGSFCSLWISVFGGAVGAIGQGIVFLPLVYELSPVHPFGIQTIQFQGWLLLASMVYVTVCTYLTHLIGHKLILVGYAQQRFAADFRSSLIRVRDQSEAIALYRGEDREQERLEARFANVKRGVWESMFYSKKLTMSSTFFSAIQELLPILLLGPAFFRGSITLGVFFRLRGALAQLNGSMSWGIEAYGSIAELRSTTNRLVEFQKVMQQVHDKGQAAPAACKADAISFTGVNIKYPDDKPLLRDVNLVVRRGDWTLVSGTEGSGKTTLQRAAAGLWPYVDGTLSLPKDQISFMPPTSKHGLRAGTLREAVSYPDPPGTYSDDSIWDALAAADLHQLLEVDKEAEGSPLDHEEDWTLRLSAGERQRMDIAHLLLSKPAWLFCDELTSHMSADGAVKAYKTLKSRLPDTTVISVAHNVDQLRPFHQSHMVVDPETRRLLPEEWHDPELTAPLASR
mmetsp:Transcript_4610/g.11105  ORF Transcript_4610/g.11105 Transcript_4610/m.11105 type:complete len:764 (-) Transcript_4610:37-2328(-)